MNDKKRSMTKEEILDTMRSMALGYESAAAKIEDNPASWITERSRECCEAFAMADSFREFSKALTALAEEALKEDIPVPPEDLPC